MRVCASLHIHGTSEETSIGCTSCFASRKEKLNCLFCAPEVRQNGSEILDFEREVSIFQLLSFYEDGRTISEPGEVNLRRLAACVCVPPCIFTELRKKLR